MTAPDGKLRRLSLGRDTPETQALVERLKTRKAEAGEAIAALRATTRAFVASGGMKPQGGGSKMVPPDLKYREKWGPLKQDDPTGWPWSQVLSEQMRQFCGIMGGCWFA